MPEYERPLPSAGPDLSSPEEAPASATEAQDTLGNGFLQQEMSKAVGRDVGPGDPVWYGIVQNDALDRSWIRKAVDIGVGSIKVRLKDTDLLEPGDGMYDFIVEAKEAGLEVVALFNNESVGTDYAVPDQDKVKERAQEVVDRLDGLVDAWEVWNEPQSIEPDRDMGADQLMTTLGNTYPIFSKTGKPVLAAPEWATGQGDDYRGQMAGWWKEHAGEFPDVGKDVPFDVMAVHGYFFDEWDEDAMIDQTMSSIADQFGPDMPVWVTEFGRAGDASGESADRQSDFIRRTAQDFGKHENVDRMFYYSLKDYPGDESGAHMGLYGQDGGKKEAADAWGLGKTGVDVPEQGGPGDAGPGGPTEWSIPRPDLLGPFEDWLDAVGASGQVDEEHWGVWFPAYVANGGDSAPAAEGATEDVDEAPADGGAAGDGPAAHPELAAEFSRWLADVGADGQADEEHWEAWYPAYVANGGWSIPRPDLIPEFEQWLADTGAEGQLTEAKWDEWFGWMQATGRA